VSARITLHCDTVWRESACAHQLMTDAGTIGDARIAASTRGWRTTPSGDYCPGCSGCGPQPADAVVAVLHPRRAP
jgi:hypothetical protein